MVRKGRRFESGRGLFSKGLLIALLGGGALAPLVRWSLARVPSGYGSVANGSSRLADDLNGRPSARGVELLEQAAVDVQAGARFVTQFGCHLERVQFPAIVA
jgi:hypothetical protein